MSILTEDQELRRSKRAIERREKEMANTAAAQMETANKAIRQVLSQDELFTKGYWACDKHHRFTEGQYGSPNKCPACESSLVNWIPGR